MVKPKTVVAKKKKKRVERNSQQNVKRNFDSVEPENSPRKNYIQIEGENQLIISNTEYFDKETYRK